MKKKINTMKELRDSRHFSDHQNTAVEKYLKSIKPIIKKIGELDHKHEADLAELISLGNDNAFKKLVCANLLFVVSTVKEYQKRGLPLIDLIAEGNIALMKAAKRFDGSRGVKLISYAVSRIHAQVIQAVADQSKPVRIPSYVESDKKIVMRVGQILEQHLERTPTEEEIAEATELSTYIVSVILRQEYAYLHFETPVNENDKDSPLYLDYFKQNVESLPGEKIDLGLMTKRLNRGLLFLSDRERSILEDSFGFNGFAEMGLREVAEKWGLTPQRVRQIKEGALDTLRRRFFRRYLREAKMYG